MPYVPDATNTTEPTDAEKASTMGLEFRTLKSYIQSVVIAGLASRVSTDGSVPASLINVDAAAPAVTFARTAKTSGANQLNFLGGSGSQNWSISQPTNNDDLVIANTLSGTLVDLNTNGYMRVLGPVQATNFEIGTQLASDAGTFGWVNGNGPSIVMYGSGAGNSLLFSLPGKPGIALFDTNGRLNIQTDYLIWNTSNYQGYIGQANALMSGAASNDFGIRAGNGGAHLVLGSGATGYGLVVDQYNNVNIPGQLTVGGTLNATLAWTSISGRPTLLSQFTNDIGAGGGSGISSFNTRTGAITLSSSDVTGALSFTPYSAANPSGFTTLAAVSGAGYQTSAGSVNFASSSNYAANAGNASTAGSAGSADHVTNTGVNGYGIRTVSTSAPSGGSDGDIWYQY